MTNFKNPVYPILFKGSPLLVTPIGDEPVSTFLVDLEQVFILLEKQKDAKGENLWTEFGKGATSLSLEIGNIIEEKNRNISPVG